jgi:ribosomal protein L11 methyltransferase
VDLDKQAVIASHDNALANQVKNVQFYLPESAPKETYDLVVANILTNPLRMLAPLLADAARQGGQIVLSGILQEQADDVMAIYQQWFDFEPPVFEDGWSCLSGRKR